MPNLLASEVMDQSAALLNDVALTTYTYEAQLPYLKKANEELEKKLIIHGAPVQRMVIVETPVLAGELTLILPDDFLVPEKLFEKATGETGWTPITERKWVPIDYIPTTSLAFWAFRNNAINFPGATVDRIVQLHYERKLTVIISEDTPEDFYLSKTFLAARTAELCARYIGMNTTIADGIRDNETLRAEDEILRIFVLNGQGVGGRRRPFNSKRLY
jgi:hypothetical protein